MNLLIKFIILTMLNVVLSTFKSIVTIKGDKTVASLVSGFYYAFYNLVLIATIAEFPLWQKCAVTFACNVIGVFFVKWVEEKREPEKLWKIEATFPALHHESILETLYGIDGMKDKYNYIFLGDKYVIYNFYCYTKTETNCAKWIVNKFNGKYFISEAKTSF